MDLLLGLSAAHLAVLKPAESMKYGLRAVNYQNRALSGFNIILQDPNPDTESLFAMFIFSAFRGILEVAISRTAGAQQKQSFVETLCALTRLFRGSKFIMKKAREAMSDETWNSIFRDEDSKLRIRHLTIDHDSFPMPEGEPLDDMLAQIDFYIPPREVGHEPSSHNAHLPDGRDQAVKYLRRLTAIQVPANRAGQLLSWPAMWTDGFIEDVSEGEPRCEAILACYGLTLRHLNDRWWAKDFGKDLVLEVASGSSSAILGPFYAQLLQMIEPPSR
ncbi:hypothetical protein M409DRAFT_29317 [Zasmidium cellare ATCC 36951]|uniref:Uncharacterized protein n=1 Tax=Zasmidium cellare ATCC 36951 TaxID=1080233 RepID=A0A6A6BZK1_ZASCE|nr:uncharacterized protein M409DRAFT_29317 [Zasmidium cellare ATCC 36951]KAF2160227.1 hypothetical protein M409DRAFT_29317 [Zasmidium cellare ATCC 36951]